MELPPTLPLDVLFRPRSVAVIGASRHRGTIGGEVFHNLISRDFAGTVYPVNRSADVVQTIHAYRTVLDIPGPVDLAVIVLPHEQVLATVDDCARKGVKAIVVIGAGFAETGTAGAALQRELTDRVRGAGMRLVGPNCLGLLSTEPMGVKAVLAAYGIRTPVGSVFLSEDEIVGAAEELGWPVALKVVSPTITHKTDIGGVVLGLTSPAELRAAHRAVLDRLATLGRLSELSGFLVERMVDGGHGGAVETLVGVTRVPEFGDLIAFGLGGVRAEIARDVVFRVNPLTQLDAREMTEQIRSVALLKGFRGSAGVDRDALVAALLRVSCLAADFPQIVALDINPLLALPPGQGVVDVDARIQLEAPAMHEVATGG